MGGNHIAVDYTNNPSQLHSLGRHPRLKCLHLIHRITATIGNEKPNGNPGWQRRLNFTGFRPIPGRGG